MTFNTNVTKVTGPIEPIKLTVSDVTINADILDTINKQFSNVKRYRTAIYNSWVKIGHAFTDLKEACNGDTKLFGMVIKKAEHDKTLPAIGKDNRAASMRISEWIDNGFTDAIIDNELSFTDWKAKFASRKSSPDTLVKAVNKANNAAIKAKDIADAKAKSPALELPDTDAVDTDAVDTDAVDTDAVDTDAVDTDAVDTVPVERVVPSIADLSSFDTDNKLVELFGLVQAEIIGRYQSENLKQDKANDIAKTARILANILNPIADAVNDSTKWTNAI